MFDRRREFVMLALGSGANVRELCRRFGVSPPTGYKWIRRYQENAGEAFTDRSRRPVHSPGKLCSDLEAQIIVLRQRHPRWGARKLRRLLQESGCVHVPSASTVVEVLRRHGLLEETVAKERASLRFEREFPNELWQMDFKGPLRLDQGSGQILAMLDDCSRFCLALRALPSQKGVWAQSAMSEAFERYGLPEAILCDNGSPWASPCWHSLTPLAVWMMRLGIKVLHGRVRHPQTQGKQERFFRTLDVEALQLEAFRNLEQLQRALCGFRSLYNEVRPHESLGQTQPIRRYQASPRQMPSRLPEPEYYETDHVRKVYRPGEIAFQNKVINVPQSLIGQNVALRPTHIDGLYELVFCKTKLKLVDLTKYQGVNHVPEHV